MRRSSITHGRVEGTPGGRSESDFISLAAAAARSHAALMHDSLAVAGLEEEPQPQAQGSAVQCMAWRPLLLLVSMGTAGGGNHARAGGKEI
jgi:hypothetical protein